MPGTVTGTIGGNAGVLFTYNGNAGASGIHLDIGFRPSHMFFQSATNTNSWRWFANFSNAAIATAASWAVDTTGGIGRTITTLSNVASIQGVQIGTNTVINAGETYNGYCFR